jgi:hypothetical protein
VVARLEIVKPTASSLLAFAWLTLILSTAGCLLTPKEITQQGTRRTAALQLPPQRAAVCIETNAENRSGLYIARHRILSDELIEVVVRYTDVLGVLAIAHLRPEGRGSAVEIWMSPNVLVDADALTQAFISGC